MGDPLVERDGILWWKEIAFLPSIHGKAAFAREARRVFLSMRFPTVAVELPESLAETTIEGIERLPRISVVSYEESGGTRVYFPLDPCDSIVEALRLGHVEGSQLEFIDPEVEEFERVEMALPDPYAVTSIGLPRFYRAVEASLPPVSPGTQDDHRERHMAWRLWKLLRGGRRHSPILCVLGMSHLRGVAARLDALSREAAGSYEDDEVRAVPPLQVSLRPIAESSLYHVLGELPYTTHLYEVERRAITLDEFEAVEKMKELLLEAKDRYHEKRTQEFERISIASFQNLLKLIRNLCLLQKRLTPTLYEMALAAKGIVGSEFAVQVIETAKRYPAAGRPARKEERPDTRETREEGGGEPDDPVYMTEDAMAFGKSVEAAQKRYVDEAKVWKKLRLEPPPPRRALEKWRTAWNPNQTCSWTPEDILIENFAGHVRARALAECGLLQERLEEFQTSFKDGIHIRETIRNLHLGKVIVKETPIVQGQVGAVVVIYEPPDPARFPWKITWLPEFEWESVLAFYATSYKDDLVGPGIARATYGGQLFLRAGRWIRDIWTDPSFREARSDDERLVLAAAVHAPERFIAYLAKAPPTPRMKEFAGRAGKRIIYLPLSSFSRTTLEKLRRFHVLNGKPVRSYARRFIR